MILLFIVQRSFPVAAAIAISGDDATGDPSDGGGSMIGGASRGSGRGSSRGSGRGSSRGSGRGSSRGSGSRGSGRGSSRVGGGPSSCGGSAGASRGGGGRGSDRRGGTGGIYGYSDSAPPTLGGDNKCPHCLCTPCVVSTSPSFLEGRAAPDGRNAHKRYPLYSNFWRVLNELGVWRHEEYLARKVLRTSVSDVREIMPTCVLNVRK